MTQDITRDISVVLPVLNEAKNLEVLLPSLSDYSIYVVDDGSLDGTQGLCKRYENVTLIERGSKKGLVSAELDGMEQAKDHSEYIVVMDADLSHNPKYIDSMVRVMRDKHADLVIGSRYIRNGKTNDSFERKVISYGANTLFKFAFTRKIKDATSGFRVYSNRAANYLITSRESDPISNSYAGQIDIVRRLFKEKFNIMEFPIVFTPREDGKSKLGTSDIKEFALLAGTKGHIKRYYGVVIIGLLMNQTVLSFVLSHFLPHVSLVSAGTVLVLGLSVGGTLFSPNSIRRKRDLIYSLYNKVLGPMSVAIMFNLLVFSILVRSGINFPIADLAGIACAVGIIYGFMP